MLAAAERAADPSGQAHAHHHLGKALTRGGRLQEARDHLRRAAALHAQHGERLTQADAELELAEVLCSLDELPHALVCATHALRAYETAGHNAGRARALNAIGWGHIMLGRHSKGLACCERALDLARLADEPYIRYLQAAILDSIGYAHHHLGHRALAVARYREALRVYPDDGGGFMAIVLDHLGDSYEADGDHAGALGAWDQALSVLEDAQHPAVAGIRAKISKISASQQADPVKT